jgi:hypothetical protein
MKYEDATRDRILNGHKGVAGGLLRQIQHLYRIEARLREHPVGPHMRTPVRASESIPLSSW